VIHPRVIFGYFVFTWGGAQWFLLCIRKPKPAAPGELGDLVAFLAVKLQRERTFCSFAGRVADVVEVGSFAARRSVHALPRSVAVSLG
jgi:hypothetical protein